VLLAGLVHVLLLFMSVHWYGATGAAMAVLTTEMAVTTLMAAALRRNRIPLFAKATAA
jgi:hypothetical protein